MKGRKCRILALLALVLIISGGVTIFFQQQQQVEQARVTYYTNVLAQAPCLENLCPGFNKGRALALEQLSNNDLIKRASVQGESLIGFAFTHGESEKGIGSGGIYFDTDVSGTPRTIRRIHFSLYHLSLGTVLSALGEPDEFLFVSGCGMGFRVHAQLLYLKQGVEVIIEYATRQPNIQVLTDNTWVSSVEYFSPNSFQEHILESLDWYFMNTVAYDLNSSVTVDNVLAQIRPWPGIEALPTPSADFCPR